MNQATDKSESSAALPPTVRHEWVTYVCLQCNRIRTKGTLPPPCVYITEYCTCASEVTQPSAAEEPASN